MGTKKAKWSEDDGIIAKGSMTTGKSGSRQKVRVMGTYGRFSELMEDIGEEQRLQEIQ